MSLLEEICSCNSWFVYKKILKIMKNCTKKINNFGKYKAIGNAKIYLTM